MRIEARGEGEVDFFFRVQQRRGDCCIWGGVGFLPLFKTCLRSVSFFFDMISSTRMHRGRF